MIQRGFLDKELKVKDLLAKKKDSTFYSLSKDSSLKEALEIMDMKAAEIMGEAFPEISTETLLKDLNKYITKEVPAVVTVDQNNQPQIITQYDIIQAL